MESEISNLNIRRIENTRYIGKILDATTDTVSSISYQTLLSSAKVVTVKRRKQ